MLERKVKVLIDNFTEMKQTELCGGGVGECKCYEWIYTTKCFQII